MGSKANGSGASDTLVLFNQTSKSSYVYQLNQPAQTVAVYFITPTPSKPQLTVQDSLNLTGSYVFAPPQASSGYTIDYIASIAQTINSTLGYEPSSILHALVWLEGPIPLPPQKQQWNWIQFYQAPAGFLIDIQASDVLNWGQIGLDVKGARIGLNETEDGFSIDEGSFAFSIDLLYGGQSLRADYVPPLLDGSPGWLVSLPLAGTMAGSMSFALGFEYSDALKYFGLEFIYGYGGDNTRSPGSSKVLRYRTLAPSTGNKQVLTIQFYLNPILPFDPAATRFERSDAAIAYNPSDKPLQGISAPYFFTINGASVTLQALSPGAPELPQGAIPGSFGLSVAPPNTMPASASNGPDVYLSPVGCYKVVAKGTPSATVDLMPGLSALEFVRLQPGDLIAFVNNQPAYALGYGFAASTPSTNPLSSQCTTSWATVVAPTAGPSRSYYSQPIAATYFAPPQNARAITFQKPVQSKLWDFTPAAPAPAPLFPIVPYGGIYLTPVAKPRPTKPADLRANDRMQFEAAVLANQRHRQLARAASGPVFMASGATQPSAQLASAVTQQGLHVDLAANGAWKAITLAKSGPTNLQINNPTADLANVLTRDQLFLVVTNRSELTKSPIPKPDTDFLSILKIADFNFELDVSLDGNTPPIGQSTILVIKLNNQLTLQQLVTSPSVWADTDRFCPNAAAASKHLSELIQNIPAPRSGQDAFDYFRNEVLANPEWTGIIAFDAQVDGNGMDPDFQMLLGGINGDLRAHHVGVELNRIDSSTAALGIVQSSLFGVINYTNSPPLRSISKYAGSADIVDYEVKNLTVSFRNSQVVLFQSTVALTLNALFGRKVLGTPANTIEISGRYQIHNGQGTVTFDNTETNTFSFVAQSPPAAQVLDKVMVSRAQLTPVGNRPLIITLPSKGRSPSFATATVVTCAFQLEGELFFKQAPFPGQPSDISGAPLDLFSYGTSTLGMDFTGLSVVINFTLDPASGSMVPGSKTINVDYSPLQPTPSPNAIRPDGFVNSLPLRFSRFVTGADLAAAVQTAFPVNFSHIVEDLNAPPPPTATRTPSFALEYDFSLGSLGKLSDDHGGITAKLLLGWGPSAVAPDSDAATVLLQLPQLSAGTAGFNLMGVLKTQLGAGSMVRATANNGVIYAILFNNVQLSALGLSFPPGLFADFILFAKSGPGPSSNVAWFLSAKSSQASLSKPRPRSRPEPQRKLKSKSKPKLKRQPKRKQPR